MLTPVFLYNAIISCCFFIASSCLGYFSLILSISGFNTLIFAEEMYDFRVRGEINSLIAMVIRRMMIPKFEMNLLK